jgi:GNAT superfamily N-acetyltransferase
VNVRPMAAFTYLYPFDPATVAEIAYYFEFDYADGCDPSSYTAKTIDLTRAWMADNEPGSLTIVPTDDGSVIVDTRRGVEDPPLRAPLRGWKASVYGACDRAHSVGELLLLPELQGSGVGEQELSDFLERCRYHQFAVESGGRWLSLAVHQPPRAANDKDRAVRFLALTATN